MAQSRTLYGILVNRATYLLNRDKLTERTSRFDNLVIGSDFPSKTFSSVRLFLR